MTREAKRYTLRVMGLMGVYAVLVFLSTWLLKHMPANSWRVAIAVMPAIPLLFVVWSITRFVRKMDELQRAIHSEAVTFSFLATIVMAITYGFLENAGLPHVPLLYVPILMCILWGVGAGIASRRYQ